MQMVAYARFTKWNGACRERPNNKKEPITERDFPEGR